MDAAVDADSSLCAQPEHQYLEHTAKATPGYATDEGFWRPSQQQAAPKSSACQINQKLRCTTTVRGWAGGSYYDWIELYNSGRRRSTQRLGLTDTEKPLKWKFPGHHAGARRIPDHLLVPPQPPVLP